MNLKYHLHAAYEHRYAKYAVICIHSLIYRGNVDPRDIVFSVAPELINDDAVKLIDKLGVQMFSYTRHQFPTGKFSLVNEIFRHLKPDKIVQLDTDLVLTQDIDLTEVFCQIGDTEENPSVMAYKANNIHNPKQTFAERSCLSIPGFRYTDDPVSFARYGAFVKAHFQFELEDFIHWLEEGKWPFGGIIIFDRDRPSLWKEMLLFNWFTTCDETLIQLGRYYQYLNGYGFTFSYIDNNLLQHRVNPEKLDLEKGLGFLHYAGDWYRLHDREHAMQLSMKYQQIAHEIN